MSSKKSSRVHYCFPAQKELTRDFDAQKGRPYLNFEKRGMTDAAFDFLCNLVLALEDPSKVCVNVRDNCLTNASVDRIKELQQQGIRVLSEKNNFQQDALKSFDRMRVHATSLAVHMTSSKELLEKMTDPDNRAALQNLYKLQEGTDQKLDKLTDIVTNLSNTVGKLDAGVKVNSPSLEKMFKRIEMANAQCIQEEFPEMGFRILSKEDLSETSLSKHEIDAALLSGDGTVLILGESKHDLTDEAFEQLDLRIGTFCKAKMHKQLTGKLKKVKTVLGAVCADVVSEDMRQRAKKEGHLILSKKHDYRVENRELMNNVTQES